MTYGLYEALRIVLEEGLDACFARHRTNHLALKAGLAAIGIGFAAREGHQLPMLNAVQDSRRRRRRGGAARSARTDSASKSAPAWATSRERSGASA